MEAKQVMFPVLFYEVCDKPTWQTLGLKPSEKPERVLVVAPHAPTRDAIMRALHEVEKREPKIEANVLPRSPLSRTRRFEASSSSWQVFQ